MEDCNMKEIIRNDIERSIAVKSAILNNEAILSQIEAIANKMISAYRSKKKVMFAGNGGSAADAQHLAAELVNRFCFDHIGLPALALSTDSSIVTSIGNDYGYDFLFSRQVAAQGCEGDIFVGISTSGNSENIVKALKTCKDKQIFTVGFTGGNGGKMSDLCDICIIVPSKETARIQEAHIMLGHILCGIVESNLFEKK